MEYNFKLIEKKWQEEWNKNDMYKVSSNSFNPKFYVLDMFPYPSGAGLHVGHPLGYIASDIYARYKRLKGFNVLHPMGFDAFGLPAEQYAIDHGIHPAVSTEQNINNFKEQLDNIGFCYDWSREVRTCDPEYYKWTQWIFLQMYDSWYNRLKDKAERIKLLSEIFEQEGNVNHPIPSRSGKDQIPNESSNIFSAEKWNGFDERTKQTILMQYRLAYLDYADVWWCEALGTVLANDEVVDGVSERGGHPVEKKKMRQWFLRITEYADRLLQGLEHVEFTESLKEQQKNWIGRSKGAEIRFRLTPGPSPKERGTEDSDSTNFSKDRRGEDFGYFTNTVNEWKAIIDFAKLNRKNSTEAENKLWEELRNRKLQGFKFRRQHPVSGYIPDFVCIEKKLAVEIDGGYHDEAEQQKFDKARAAYLLEHGYRLIRFTNDEVFNNISSVLQRLGEALSYQVTMMARTSEGSPSPSERGLGGEVLKVYTTRPDTIFGVDFMVLAPEHELVQQITTPELKQEVEKYLSYVNSRSDRERMAEVKQITGCFTGAYAANPFNGRKIPVWIADYVLIGYGTGAIMGVPCGDQRDFNFAKHFNIPITNIIGDHFNGEEANPTKDAILQNSDFLNGMMMKDAIEVVINKLEELGVGKRKINYKMHDAGFSRQRYWGEPFPIIYKAGIPYAINDPSLSLPEEIKKLPVELPYVESYSSGPEGEGPLANLPEWYLIPNPSPQAEKGKVGAANVPKYSVYTPAQYELARTLRNEHTEAEKKLWELLRNCQLGIKFRRQHSIDAYIVDFVSLQNKLIVEADGGYHESEEQKKYDENRTRVLKEIGFDVLRFTNEEILKNPYKIKDKIKSKLSDSTPFPLMEKGQVSELTPSPLVERGQGGEVRRETNTMPGYAGSSWYFLRYMDPHNENAFCDRKASDYWGQVDLYIGGTEHAVGHLLYSRMWTKVLYDLNLIGHDEPYKKLVNQGKIGGDSRLVYRFDYLLQENISARINFPIFVSFNHYKNFINDKKTPLQSDLVNFVLSRIEGFNGLSPEHFLSAALTELHVDVNIVNGLELDLDAFRNWKPEFANAHFILDDGSVSFPSAGREFQAQLKEGTQLCEGDGNYICGSRLEKMSKRYFNVVNPDDIVSKYGADTFRMYEMFLGPIDQDKPWDTKGIEGVHRFLKKFWRLFADESKGLVVTNEKATDAELKVLHKTIKKIEEDTERFSFNTAVSSFMIAVNELTDLKCHKKEILLSLLILLTPYAPHICEELYQQLNSFPTSQTRADDLTLRGWGGDSVLDARYPQLEEKYLVESSKEYPISINGKLRTTMNISLDSTQSEVEKMVLANDVVQKWLASKVPQKVIYVKSKMINIVV